MHDAMFTVKLFIHINEKKCTALYAVSLPPDCRRNVG